MCIPPGNVSVYIKHALINGFQGTVAEVMEME